MRKPYTTATCSASNLKSDYTMKLKTEELKKFTQYTAMIYESRITCNTNLIINLVGDHNTLNLFCYYGNHHGHYLISQQNK